MKARREVQFSDKAAWIRTLPCEACKSMGYEPQLARTEACHVKSRGAGGTSEHLIPLCTFHHGSQHVLGIKTFEERFGISLTEMAAHLETLWQMETT